MESKKENKERTSKMSENEKVKADLRNEATRSSNDFGEQRPVGGSPQDARNRRVTEPEPSFGTQNQATTQTTSSSQRMKKNQNREYRSGDSNGSFLSSVKSNKGAILGIAGALAGGALLFRGLKGKSSSANSNEVKLHTKQTILRSREELYAYWRNLENLPDFMSHIKEVEEIDEKRSRWTAEIPGGIGTIDWEADIEQDITNKYISWRSIADADIENAGEVRFEDAPAGKGTIVETTISYRPPAGNAGELVAELLNPAFEKIVKKDLKDFKKHMEKGGKGRNQLFR